MPRTKTPIPILEEIADFLASIVDREKMLNYRPSQEAQDQVSQLLLKQNETSLTAEEKRELDQFAQANVLMRMVKAKLHARRASRR